MTKVINQCSFSNKFMLLGVLHSALQQPDVWLLLQCTMPSSQAWLKACSLGRGLVVRMQWVFAVAVCRVVWADVLLSCQAAPFGGCPLVALLGVVTYGEAPRGSAWT